MMPDTTNTSGGAGSLRLGAFVDLVGVRKLAAADPSAYFERLNLFHEAVGDSCEKLTAPDDKVFFFSDCAYVASLVRPEDKSNTRLLDYMSTLRSELFGRGIYFKAVVGCYDIQQRDAAEFPGKSVETSQSRKKLIDGYYFGNEAAELYRFHEEYKGIGIRVIPPSESQLAKLNIGARRLAKDVFRRQRFVTSCFVDITSKSAIHYLDIPFTLADRDPACSLFERILENILLAKTQDDRFGPYYVSALVTWIRSDKFINDFIAKEFLDAENIDSIDPLLSAFCTGRLKRCFRNIAGYEQVFFAFVHTLVEGQSKLDESVRRMLWKKVACEDGLLQRLKRVPQDVCGSETRKKFVDAVNAALKELSAPKKGK